MLILSLDTSSAAGSAAIVRDGAIVVERSGSATRTHGERLPRELMTLLDEARARLDDVDVYAIATGPGSFTGLRIGIATIQGLALAHGKLVAPVTTFEALAASSFQLPASGSQLPAPSSQLPSFAATAVWIDAHRGEVFAALYADDGKTVLQSPTSLSAEATLDAWSDSLSGLPAIRFAGDGAIKYHEAIESRLGPRAGIPPGVPPLAGAIGRLAGRNPGRAVRPHAVVPLYVRRPDAELARDRRQGDGA